MVANLGRRLESKTACWLPLDQTVYEVCSLKGPIIGDLVLFYLHLFPQHFIPDLSPIPAVVRPSPHHKLEGNDSQREVVY